MIYAVIWAYPVALEINLPYFLKINLMIIFGEGSDHEMAVHPVRGWILFFIG